jgi:FKBP-type peptidyl-prolyl cis-trans isomerase 2
VSIHFVGLIDATSQQGKRGQQFDDTRHANEGPVHFRIHQRGAQRQDHHGGMDREPVLTGKTARFIIKGFDMGLLGLCVGAHATLVLPSTLAYGDAGLGSAIPGGATLRYEVG